MPDSPDPIPNAFEDQRFRLRTADGEPVTRSFRELVTEPGDPAYALDYPQPFYDVAALNLLTFLAQWAFEPEDAAALAARLARPMDDDEFEAGIAEHRAPFALTGDGPRFMQAPGPGDPKKTKPVEDAVLITHAGDKSFLHRGDPDWAVAPDQAALFLFTRNTFYEGAGGGAGQYKKGTNGDTPVRSLATVPAGRSGLLHLRKSFWLNVLSRGRQQRDAGRYADLGGEGYDGLFWVNPPEEPEIPTGGLTLRAGLGWMTAYHWLWYEPLDAPAVCVVTGDPLPEGALAARTLTKWGTRISYGTKSDQDADVRADRLFRHPNVPVRKTYDQKTGDITGREPFYVNRTWGLAEAVGASFFGGRGKGAPFEPAPAVEQLSDAPVWRQVRDLSPPGRLLVFGFHMLSKYKNVHGGVEQDATRFRPLVGETEGDTAFVNVEAATLMKEATQFAKTAAGDLQRAVQRASGLGVRAEEDPSTGRITLKKDASTASVDDPFGDDALTAYWRDVGAALADYAHQIAATAYADADHADDGRLQEAKYELTAAWETTVTALVWRHFDPVYDDRVLDRRTMPYAAAARRMLAASLKKHRTTEPTSAETTNAS